LVADTGTDCRGTALNESQTGKIDRDVFLEEGYVVLRGLLEPARDLAPLRQAYSRLLDQLFEYAMGEDFPSAIPHYHELDFPTRLATLIGLTRNSVFDHLDPPLSIYDQGYRRWPGAPSAQPPELFSLIRQPRILDAVEQLIGPELWATPAHHINIKLGSRHADVAGKAQDLPCRPDLVHPKDRKMSGFLDNFLLGQTNWHKDEYRGMGDPDVHNYMTVWVPMTEADASRSALRVLPKSHLNGYGKLPSDRESKVLTLETQPGDVVIMAGKLFHSSTKNVTDDEYRWAFNMRYIPVGYLCGRSYLPGFVARSRANPDTEFRDPFLWARYWKIALEYYDRYLYPMPNVFGLSQKQVRDQFRQWSELVPHQHAWPRLKPPYPH